jgi:glucose/mannose transport system substrate-binding protein
MQTLQKRATKSLAATAVLALGLVGCASTTGADDTSATSGSDETAASATGSVEVFSWWTGGGEEAGLNALVEVFNAEYPN